MAAAAHPDEPDAAHTRPLDRLPGRVVAGRLAETPLAIDKGECAILADELWHRPRVDLSHRQGGKVQLQQAHPVGHDAAKVRIHQDERDCLRTCLRGHAAVPSI